MISDIILAFIGGIIVGLLLQIPVAKLFLIIGEKIFYGE
jgi:hypothetical protein